MNSILIKVWGSKTQIGMIEDTLEKSGLFRQDGSSREWKKDDGVYYKRINYIDKFEVLKNKMEEEKENQDFFNLPDGIDEELPFI